MSNAKWSEEECRVYLTGVLEEYINTGCRCDSEEEVLEALADILTMTFIGIAGLVGAENAAKRVNHVANGLAKRVADEDIFWSHSPIQ